MIDWLICSFIRSLRALGIFGMDPSLYNWLGSVYPIYTGVADAVDERFVHGRFGQDVLARDVLAR